MNRFYDTNPWVIPAAPKHIADFFINNGERLSFKKGQVVSGPTARRKLQDYMIYNHSGIMAQCYLTHDENKPQAISLTLPGRVINYLGFIGINISKETIMCLRDTEAYILPITFLKEYVSKHESMREEIYGYIHKCIATDYDGFTLMFTCDTSIRLAYFFLALANNYNERSNDEIQCIPLKLSHAELSYVMFTSVKTIDRIMPTWKSQGVIETRADTTIINRHLLVSMISEQ
ncbi:Crp/Fnr family transcriptional regulator [Ferrimonas sp. SCSIO 43195]|uniref:Crp/Fnr family transcriptional regulator n=1 Tax=Ferrimonas sp. SCSIO 43195 TaxID=2822844 RepID=UPI002075ECF4|nr:Crp/Fnr family transcriptional regulator [Ferrimonas sp. SCSIO 43195]USD37540.1 Crp/Fnr family transcriptional regulator [Ferrimonas sp. SCSIO 43195]